MFGCLCVFMLMQFFIYQSLFFSLRWIHNSSSGPCYIFRVPVGLLPSHSRHPRLGPLHPTAAAYNQDFASHFTQHPCADGPTPYPTDCKGKTTSFLITSVYGNPFSYAA